MTSSSSSSRKDLPPHWIVKTSRQYPSLSYYANVKTGQSTWKHPSLLKESELKVLTKRKGKKKLPENEPEIKKGKATEMPDSTTSVEEQESKSLRKATFTPIASVQSNQDLNDDSTNSTDDKGPKTKQVANDNSGNHKSKPVKFTIKNKNALSKSPETGISPMRPRVLHPSIVLAKRIASRDSPLKAKRRVGDDKQGKEATCDEVQNAKKHKSDQETLKLPAASIETATEIKEEDKHKETETYNNTSECTKKAAKRKRKKERNKTHKEAEESIPELTCHHGEEDKPDFHKDKEKVMERENQLYEDFIVRKSNLWKKNRYGTQDGGPKKTIEPESHTDKEESESLPDKVRLEQPKEEASVSSEQVPYEDSPRVSKPEPVSETVAARIEDYAMYPEAIDMEIDEEELNMEIANFRDSASYSSLAISKDLPNSKTCHSSASLYFVVDTNVLISDIDFLQELKSAVVGGRESVVVVPYVALQEMDGLKKSASIGRACQAAVRWCNKHFEARHPRVQGQTYSDYRITLEENKRANADDLVRDCCLLLAKEGLDVCLLTNDVNLRNKALMSSLSAISAKDLKSKLGKLSNRHIDPSPTSSEAGSKWEESQMTDISLRECEKGVVDAYKESPCSTAVPRQHKNRSGQKARRASTSMPSGDVILLERITASLLHTLGNILQDVMKEIYEDLWLTILKHKPPWSLQEVFACWEKHWIAAMIDKFPSNMKELLAEISKLLTAPHVDVQKLLKRTQLLISYVESTPYSKHILPIQDSSSVVDMCEAFPSTPPCSTPPSMDSPAGPHQPTTTSGMINVEKMINQVGAHVTHFVALVLTAFGIQHNLQKLPNLSASESLTPDNAKTSGVNLHKVIMSLGTAITRCVNERTSSALQEFGHLLSNFWSEAHLPCPHLPFTECDLRHFVENPSGVQYLECVVRELENLLRQLTQVLAGL